MSAIEQTELLIAGGGPIGLFTALCAVRHGLDVIVIEHSFRGTPRGHTTLLHPSSIRLLGELGLSPLLLRSGQLVEEVELRVDGHPQRLKLPFPALAITQALFEEALLKVLRKEEIELRATCEVTEVSQTDEHAAARVVRRERIRAASKLEDEHWELVDSSTIRAQYIVAADGRASRVREAIGIPTFTGAARRYAMFEFPSQSPPEPELVIANGLSHFILPLLERRARCSFELEHGSQQPANLAHLTALVAQRAPRQPVPRELDWSAIIHFAP
ncbi:MAG: NAD(P)/FAD-dependent oxidoreductase, partial [Polyangiaceae bacterium]